MHSNALMRPSIPLKTSIQALYSPCFFFFLNHYNWKPNKITRGSNTRHVTVSNYFLQQRRTRVLRQRRRKWRFAISQYVRTRCEIVVHANKRSCLYRAGVMRVDDTLTTNSVYRNDRNTHVVTSNWQNVQRYGVIKNNKDIAAQDQSDHERSGLKDTPVVL